MPPLKKLIAAASVLALSAGSSMATAATAAPRSVNPLVAVGMFGTQASAQAAYPQVRSATALSGAAVAAQGSAGAGGPPPSDSGFGVHWLLIALDVIIVIAGVSTLFDDDDGDGAASPA